MNAFSRSRRATAVAVLLAVGAMLSYPGGTPLDPSTQRYLLAHNFLSDLGTTVALNGSSNRVGAVLFTASLVILLVGAVTTLAALVRIYAVLARSPRLAWGAVALGLFTCAAFVGVAVTPADRLLELHLLFTRLAFRTMPLAALLLGLATWNSPALPARVSVAWFATAGVLMAYLAMLQWGPSHATDAGLMAQVLAQKFVVAAILIGLTYQGYAAQRATATP